MISPHSTIQCRARRTLPLSCVNLRTHTHPASLVASPKLTTTKRNKIVNKKTNVLVKVAEKEASFSESAPVGLPRTAVVGVLGGGQLGRMMSLAAANLGVRVACLDPTPEAPAAVASRHVQGHFRDAAAIKEFVRAAGVNVLTVEIEHVDTHALEAAANEASIEVQPTPRTIRVIQDKLVQKQLFASHGVPVPGFAQVDSVADVQAAAQKFGLPLMLKARRFAYDGRGNAVVSSDKPEDIAAAAERLGGFSAGLFIEQWCPFEKELAIMVVRSRVGEVVSYPLTETVQQDSICLYTETPAAVAPSVFRRATEVAERAIACLEGAGIFGVEMFVTRAGEVLLNEVAPRPHNSGHYTIDACRTSQFENHLRAVLGWPLGSPEIASAATALPAAAVAADSPTAIMLNILGRGGSVAEGTRRAEALMALARAHPLCKIHWYGKEEVKKGRKVGHINIVAATRAAARETLSALLRADGITLSPEQEQALAEQPVTDSSAGAVAPQVGIIMGSDSDLPTMKAAAAILEEFGVPVEVSIVSAHRTPERLVEYARTAHSRGLKVIIAGAGGAAHLPGMVAAMTPLPVVGVPVKPAGSHLDGVDALLSIVQMPKGVPVATVAIGNAANAGLLAARIIGTQNPALLNKMLKYQEEMRDVVLEKASRLETVGWAKYSK